MLIWNHQNDATKRKYQYDQELKHSFNKQRGNDEQVMIMRAIGEERHSEGAGKGLGHSRKTPIQNESDQTEQTTYPGTDGCFHNKYEYSEK